MNLSPTRTSLFCGKIQGNSPEFRPIDDSKPANSQWNSFIMRGNSLSGETGKILTETAKEKPFSRHAHASLSVDRHCVEMA